MYSVVSQYISVLYNIAVFVCMYVYGCMYVCMYMHACMDLYIQLNTDNNEFFYNKLFMVITNLSLHPVVISMFHCSSFITKLCLGMKCSLYLSSTVCMYACMYVCMYVCMHVCMYVHMMFMYV